MNKSGQLLKLSLAVALLAAAGMAYAQVVDDTAEVVVTDAATVSANLCVAPNNGQGTATMPAIGCKYHGPTEYHRLKHQLSGQALADLEADHSGFLNIAVSSGGTHGGQIEAFDSHARIKITGVGPLEGYTRVITVPLAAETHTGPRNPGEPVQDFETTMYRLEGSIAGDEDFALLHITAGDEFGLPSPGHTTLTYQPESDTFVVDSFFDITYRIEFVGAPGSPFEGYGGTTEDTLTVTAYAAGTDADADIASQ